VGFAAEDALAQEQAAKDISHEVRLLRQLDHPNVVQYYSSFTTSAGTGSTLWIVMEFCSGVSLQSFTASAREKGLAKLPEEQTWQIFVQLCLALRYLHVEKGICHRDLTPNNVLVQSHTLAVKVADFGLARQKAGAGTAAASMMKSMVGTILYSCPEIVQHRPYTHKADVWALGCLLYKMATLRDPFQGNNPLSVARRIVECEYKRLDEVHHSEMLVRTCGGCLTVSAEERPDIQEVCQMITPALVRHLEAVQRAAMGGQQHPHVPEPPVSWLFPSSPQSSPSNHMRRAGILLPAPEGHVEDAESPDQRDVQPIFEEPGPGSQGKAQTPKRVLHSANDPIEKAVLITHRLAFVAQLPPGDPEDQRRATLDCYQRWFFGNPHCGLVVKREVSRLAQCSQEPVEREAVSCNSPSATRTLQEGAEGPPAPDGPARPVLTYEQLHAHLLEVCSEHGYGARISAGAVRACSSGKGGG